MKTRVMTSLLLGLICHITNAQYVLKADDVTFSTGSKTITAYTNDTEKDIEIPASFTIDGEEYAVLKIDDRAFYSKSLTGVKFPNTITEIGKSAFVNCELSTLELPNSLQIIKDEAFLLNSLSSITLPESFTFLGKRAFNDNEITTVNGQPSTGLFFARADDGGEDVTKVVSYGGTSKVIDFVPNTVLTLGEDIFNSTDLTSFVFPTGLITIENSALRWCGLTEVDIPNTVETIGSTAFYNNKLTSLTIGNSVKTIGSNCFIGGELTDITIPSSVTSIGSLAFFNNNLTNVNIGNSVTTLGGGCFSNNEIITINNLPSDGIFYARLSDGSDDESTIISYGGVADVIDFLPNTVTEIGSNAFRESGITAITFPSSLKTIGSNSFYMNSLSSVNLPAGIEYVKGFAFSASGVSTVSLPNTAYQGYTTYWYSSGETVTEMNILTNSYALIKDPIDYTITYHTSGGTHSNSTIYNIESDELVLEDAVKDAYVFIGWYTDENLTNSITTIPSNSYGDKEVWASYSVATAIDNTPITPELKVYPTLANNTITVEGAPLNKHIAIYNLQGVMLSQVAVIESIQSLNISALSAGTYFVKVGNATQKFMVKK